MKREKLEDFTARSQNSSTIYRIYGRKKGSKKFYPFNESDGELVTKIIHATIYKPSVLRELKKEVEYMNSHNPDYEFEIRAGKF